MWTRLNWLRNLLDVMNVWFLLPKIFLTLPRLQDLLKFISTFKCGSKPLWPSVSIQKSEHNCYVTEWQNLGRKSYVECVWNDMWVQISNAEYILSEWIGWSHVYLQHGSTTYMLYLCLQDFSISAFSPCGNYLAGCTSGGDICVWNLNLQTCIMSTRHDRGYSICGLAWNPSGNGEIAYCDVMGQLGTVEGCIACTPAISQDNSTFITQASLSECWENSTLLQFTFAIISSYWMYRMTKKEYTHFINIFFLENKQLESTFFSTWSSYSDSFFYTFLRFTALQPELPMLFAQCPSGIQMPWKHIPTFEAWFLP